MFRICSRIKKYVYAYYCNPGHDGSLYDCLLDSIARVQSVDDKAVFVFVSNVNAHHSEWLKPVSVLLIGTGVMPLIFAICWVVSSCSSLSHSHCWQQTLSCNDGCP